MSGVVRSVKKIFKKVTKTVKKVAPYVIAAGALYFTASAALNGGTFIGTNTTINNIFGDSLLGDTLRGTVTQASYGSLIGGGIAAATGGDIKQGIVGGAAVGAVTGGVTGFVGSQNTLSSPTGGSNISGGSGDAALRGDTGQDTLAAPPPAASKVTLRDPMPDIPPTYTDSTGARAGEPKGKLLSFWDEIKNSELASGIAGGVVQGIGAALSADEQRDYTEAARVKADADAEARRAAWGGGDVGLLTAARRSEMTGGTQTPTQRFDPSTQYLT
jgi:hypothetical protein